MFSKELDLSKVAKYIKQGKINVNQIRDQEIIMMLGETGAGKTTTILYITGSKLIHDKESDNIISVDSENDFSIGVGTKSETKFISVKVIQNENTNNKPWYITDSPGFKDTEGQVIEIANSVTISTVLKLCKSILPVLVVNYNTVLSGRAVEFRQQLQHVSNLFGNNIDALKNSLIVLFTHCTPNVTLKKIKTLISNMIDDESEANTNEVLDMLELIQAVMGGRYKSRVEIIRPCSNDDPEDEEEFKMKLLQTLKKTPKIEHPGEFCQVSLTDVAKLTLNDTLVGIKNSIPKLVEAGKIDSIIDYYLILKELSSAIESAKSTMTYVANSVCKIVRDTELNFKKRFEVILSSLDLWVEGDVTSAIDYRNLLASVASMRVYFPENVPIDTLESLENFIVISVKHFIDVNSQGNDFGKLKLVANKVGNIAKIITFVPRLNDTYQSLIRIITSKVAAIGDALIEPQQLGKLTVGFYEDKLAYLRSAVTEIGEILPDIDDDFFSAITERLNEYFRSEENKCARGLVQVDQEVFNTYSFFKAIRKSKVLPNILPSAGEHYSSLHGKLHAQCTALIGDFDQRIDPDSIRNLMVQLTTLLNVDSSVKNELSSQKNQILLRFEQEAEKIVSELDELLYADSPNYRQTAQQLQKLNTLKWVDDFTMGANRITIKYEESVTIITQSILQLRKNIIRCFNRQRFSEAKELFLKYAQLNFLRNIVKELTSEQEEVKDWLEVEVEKIYSAIHTKCVANECPLTEFQTDLSKLNKLEDLAEELNLSVERENTKAEITSAIKSRLGNYERIIIGNLQHFNTYKEDLDILDELKQIIEFPDFPNEAKNSYNQNLMQITQKLNQCMANLRNHVNESLPQDANALFEHFSKYVVLFQHIPKIVDDVNLSRSIIAQLNSQAPNFVLENLRSKNYREVLNYLTQLEKGNNFSRSINAINSYFEKMYADLEGYSNLYRIFNPDGSFNPLSIYVFPTLSDLDSAITILSKLEGVTFAERCNLLNIYAIFDKKISTEIKLNHNRLNGNQFRAAEFSQHILEQNLFNHFPKNDLLTESTALFLKFDSVRSDILGRLSDCIEDKMDSNVNEVNSIYSELKEIQRGYPGVPIYGTILSNLSSKITSYFVTRKEAIKQTESSVEAERSLKSLREKATTLFDELRNVAKTHVDAADVYIEDKLNTNFENFNQSFQSGNYQEVEKIMKNTKRDPKIYSRFQSKLREKATQLCSETDVMIRDEKFDSRFCSNLSHLEQYREYFAAEIDVKLVDNVFDSIKRKCEDIQTRIRHSLQSKEPSDRELKEVIILINIAALKVNGSYLITQRSGLLPLFSSLSEIIGEVNSNFERSLLQYDFYNLSKTLNFVKERNQIFTEIKAALMISKIDEAGQLAIVLETWKPFLAMSQYAETYLYGIPKKVQESWVKQDIQPIEVVLKKFINFNSDSLLVLFPRIREIRDEISREVTSLFDGVISEVEKAWMNKDYEEFTKVYAFAEKLFTIGQILNREGILKIKHLINNNIKQISDEAKSAVREKDTDATFNSILKLAMVSDNIPVHRNEVEREIANLISQFGQQNPKGILELGHKLETDGGRLGKHITRDYPQFAEIQQRIFEQKTQGHDIDWAVKNFEITSDSDPQGVAAKLFQKTVQFFTGSEQEKSKSNYNNFSKQFQKIIKESLNGMTTISRIVQNTKEMFANPGTLKITDALANLFAVWSLLKSGSKGVIAIKPHPIQVLCLFRLLEKNGADRMNPFFKQLIEVLTGEGKSVILGIASAYFALLNYDVSCICYSEYLYLRDYHDFLPIFEEFGIQDRIAYSTIDMSCESKLNSRGPVREFAKQFFESQSQNAEMKLRPGESRKKILLIDEVDVFFGSEFYGKTYNPAAVLQNPQTYQLLKFIWQNRANIQLNTIKNTQVYKDIIKMFSSWNELIDSEILKMIRDVNKHNDPPPFKPITGNRIGYKLHDQVTYSKVFGYKTAFAYFNAFDEGLLDDEIAVQNNVGIYIGCGNFSYAAIPNDFDLIMGVSGTIHCLSPKEKEIIQKYGITRLAFAPSMYATAEELNSVGANNNNNNNNNNNVENKKNKKDRRFDRLENVEVFSTEEDWFLKISNNAKFKQQAGRAVLIFFDNKDLLDKFYSLNKQSIPNMRQLHEGVDDKDDIIRKSTASGTVTLCTRPFGRGVDFICLDATTKEKGGVHVIQTFMAASDAEEVQIKGRTARQGDPGTYELLLYEDHLGEVGITNPLTDDQKRKVNVYDVILAARNAYHDSKVAELIENAQTVKQQHELTKDFLDTLIAFDGSQPAAVILMKFFKDMNKNNLIQKNAANYHIFFCLDDSGSMHHNWNELVLAVKGFVDRRISICTNAGYPAADLVTIVNYSDTAALMCDSVPITSSPHTKTKFRSGGTDFAVGLKLVYSKMTAMRADYIPVLLFMSDGGCSNGNNEITMISRDFTQRGLKIFVVGFGGGSDQSKLKMMATISGGEYMYGANGANLLSSFENISVRISDDSYSLGK